MTSSARKEINLMPSPLRSAPEVKRRGLGEGLTDEPIAQVNRGEVPNPSPVSPKGEMPILLEQNIDLENQQSHEPTSPLPIWEGRGDRSSRRADYYDYRGEVQKHG